MIHYAHISQRKMMKMKRFDIIYRDIATTTEMVSNFRVELNEYIATVERRLRDLEKKVEELEKNETDSV